MMNFLVIPDLHAPFHHKNSISFLRKQIELFDGADFEVICLGDLLDMYAFTRFIKNGDAMGAAEEFNKARYFLEELFELFPKGKLCIGNHDLRLARRASELGIPSWALKGYRDLAGIPESWEVATEFEIEGIKFFHGERLSSNSQLAVRKIGQSVVYGHTHQGSISYKASSRELCFALNCGCLIDQDAYAFEYAKSTIDKCFIGCAVVINGVPQLIPMPLGSRIVTTEKRGRGRPRKIKA
jgi:predicted phosphodiesterase